MEAESTSGWEKLKSWFAPLDTYSAPIQQQGSVGSAGGTSPLIGVIPPSRPTGPILDPRTALGISPVSRAVNVIETSVSQLPLEVQRQGQAIETPALISRPDVRTSQTEFLALTARSLSTHGNCYWRLHRAVEGPYETVSTVEVLNPELVLVDWVNGRKVYHYNGVTFADWQVKHLMIHPGFLPGSSIVMGAGPIQTNRDELQAILELNAYLKNFYRNNGVPTGVLTTDQALGQGDADAIRTRWYEVAAAGGIQVLPNNIKFQQISLDPEKSQYHASASKAVVDVARMFGIPANYLLAAIDGTAMTYSNMQDVDRTLIRYTLMSYAAAIEDAFTELLPRGQKARFNIDAFLRSDTKSRYEAHKVAIDAGFLTVDEVREIENLPALPEPKPQPELPAPPNSTEGDQPEE